MSSPAPLPQGQSVAAALGCIASWNLLTHTVQHVAATRHAKWAMEFLSQVLHVFPIVNSLMIIL